MLKQDPDSPMHDASLVKLIADETKTKDETKPKAPSVASKAKEGSKDPQTPPPKAGDPPKESEKKKKKSKKGGGQPPKKKKKNADGNVDPPSDASESGMWSSSGE